MDRTDALLVAAALAIASQVAHPQDTLVARASSWRYLDDGTDPGSVWIQPGYDDSAWAEGPSELGYGDGDEETVVAFGPDPADKHVTTYFRHGFTVADPQAWSVLRLELRADDGAVVYLNGTEVARDNLPAGAIGSGTLASAEVSGSLEKRFHLYGVPAGLLLGGDNLLAVEVHQDAVTSDDLSFQLGLDGLTDGGGSPCVEWDPDYADAQLAPVGSLEVYAGELYVSGNETVVWNGATLAPVSWGAHTLNSTRDLQALDLGGQPLLFLAGDVTPAGGGAHVGLARFDGTAWTPLTGTPPNDVDSLAAFDDGGGPALYAGGDFTSIGGVGADHVARWDGSLWKPLGAGLDGFPAGRAPELSVADDGSGPALYATGYFTLAGGQPATGVARWDGALWTEVGGGLPGAQGPVVAFDDGTASALAVYANPAPGSHAVYRLEQGQWAPFHSNANLRGIALADFPQPGSLYALEGQDLTRWGASGFDSVAGLAPGVAYLRTAVYDTGAGPELYLSADLTALTYGPSTVPSANLYRWNEAGWRTLPEPGLRVDGVIQAIRPHRGSLYVAGSFAPSSSPPGDLKLGRMDGAVWEDAASTVPGQGAFSGIYALWEHDPGGGPKLYAGGDFSTALQAPGDHVMSWDGAGWANVGEGFDDDVRAFASYDSGAGNQLYAGGSFTMSGSNARAHIAKWDGIKWRNVQGGVDGVVYALHVHDDGTGPALYVGGAFTQAGTVPASGVARFDGAWSALGAGVSLTAQPTVYALASFDDGGGAALFAGGSFTQAGGLPAHRIARWRGQAWSAVGSLGFDDTVRALEVWDDRTGSGPALYAGGHFESVDSLPAEHLAAWDGASWREESGGVGDNVFALAAFDDGSGAALFVGGNAWSTVGGTSYGSLAVRRNPCSVLGVRYCTAGTTASGCSAAISSDGFASRSAAVPFEVSVSGVEGDKDGLIYFSTNGSQESPWGNGTSLQCVAPPVRRTGLLPGTGTPGACDGLFQLDFNAWMDTHSSAAPTPGEQVYMQAWFRDPQNTSNQSTSLSDALTFEVLP